MKVFKKVMFVLVLLLLAGGWFRYFRVFGEGAKSGELNYVVLKGFVFKTYEGKLIQSGIRSQGGAINSYEFEFSVENKQVAEDLMANSGNRFNLHYKEYLGRVPWRGYSTFVVDSIISMEHVDH